MLSAVSSGVLLNPKHTVVVHCAVLSISSKVRYQDVAVEVHKPCVDLHVQLQLLSDLSKDDATDDVHQP